MNVFDPTWLLVAMPSVALLLSVCNVFVWPRGRRAPAADQSVSVLIPARDEEATIERSVRAALSASATVCEVIVCDDHSTDATPAILQRLRLADARVRILEGAALPEGWVGKPHACAQLASEARAQVLLFVDADVELEPSGVERLLDIMCEYEADVVTAVPHQVVETWAERLVVPLLYATYTSWLPLPLIWHSRDPRFLAANGQILAVKRQVYDAIGGFEAIRTEIVDDMAFCANAKRHGARVVFADGEHIASCRMYRSFDEVWRGFSKNIYEGVGSTLGVFLVAALYFATFVAPYLALLGALWIPELLLPAAVAVGANVLLRLVSVVRNRQPPSGLLTHPVGALVLLAIALNSVRWARADRILWRGRSYARRAHRHALGPGTEV